MKKLFIKTLFISFVCALSSSNCAISQVHYTITDEELRKALNITENTENQDSPGFGLKLDFGKIYRSMREKEQASKPPTKATPKDNSEPRKSSLIKFGCIWNCGKETTPAEDQERRRRLFSAIGEQIIENKRRKGKAVNCSGPVCIIEAANDFIDKTARELGNAGRDINRFYIDNEETILVVAAVAAVGWAACYDGCTFIAGVTVSGEAVGGTGAVFVPIIKGAIDEHNNTERGVPLSSPNRPTQKDFDDLEKHKDGNSDTTHVLPYQKYFFDNDRYNFRPSLFTEKHEYGVPFPESFIEVASPTKEWEFREDDAGGFTVRRRNNSEAGGMRFHGGLDIKNEVGDDVYAPMSGYVERLQKPYADSDLSGVRIVHVVNGQKFAAGVLYVKETPEVRQALNRGEKLYVRAGVTKIGTAQDVSSRPGNENVEQHVHAYWEDPKGRKMSPDGRIIIENQNEN